MKIRDIVQGKKVNTHLEHNSYMYSNLKKRNEEKRLTFDQKFDEEFQKCISQDRIKTDQLDEDQIHLSGKPFKVH